MPHFIADDLPFLVTVLAPPYAPPPPEFAKVPAGSSPLRGDAPEYQPAENNVKHAAGVAYAPSVEAEVKQSRKEATKAWKGWLRVGKHWKHAITIRAGAKKDKKSGQRLELVRGCTSIADYKSKWKGLGSNASWFGDLADELWRGLAHFVDRDFGLPAAVGEAASALYSSAGAVARSPAAGEGKPVAAKSKQKRKAEAQRSCGGERGCC